MDTTLQRDRYAPSDTYRGQSHVQSLADYEALYRRSIEDNEAFWAEQAERVTWFKPFETVKNVSFASDNVSIAWYEGGQLNASFNCLDRHLEERGTQTALIFEPDNPEEEARHITYQDLYHEVCRFANILLKHGVQKGDRVTIYMPMIPEVAAAMLACSRIGAMHSVVFAGFSPDSLAKRMLDCESTVLLTADGGFRGGRVVRLKENVDKALEQCPDVTTVVVTRRTGTDIHMEPGRDVWYHEERETVADTCEPAVMEAEDPLFILYTSGSTGTPKGVVHTTGGYLVYTSLTHQYVFDYQEGDVFWCTADVGWITGHSYMVYGPLVNGATQVFFEGVPTYPDAGRFWQVVDKHQVNQFYTAPTAIRALMARGDEFVTKYDRSSLRLLGSVGEPINPAAWEWYYHVVGDQRCPIVDTWWQTETGGVMITPLPGAIDQKPGSATRPFFGIAPQLVDAQGDVLDGAAQGILVITDSWPSQARTVYKNHERFVNTYFSNYEGKYFTGDGCRRDEDGYYWITGRVDDVINVSGHRMGTAEIESALVHFDRVAEAAVVGYPHEVKGQGIYCYVTLNAGEEPTNEMRQALIQHVRTEIGPIAKPDVIHFTRGLPKTRSGKIMRRILRKIAANEHDQLGDTSTLADPSVVDDLIEHRQTQ